MSLNISFSRQARPTFGQLLHLPPEIWRDITNYLEPLDIGALLFTNPKVHQRLLNGGIGRFVLTDPISSFPRFLSQSGTIRHLSLMLPRYGAFLNRIRNTEGDVIATLPRNLTRLSLQFYGSFKLLEQEIPHLTQLQHLTIATGRRYGLADVFLCLPLGLQSLSIITTIISTPTNPLPPNLTRLSIKPPRHRNYQQTILSNAQFAQFQLPSTLLEFKFIGNSFLTSECFVHLPRGLKRLHLQLRQSTIAGPPNMTSLPRELTFLKLKGLDWKPTFGLDTGLPDKLLFRRHSPLQDDYFFRSPICVFCSTDEWDRLISTRAYFNKLSLPLNRLHQYHGPDSGDLVEAFGMTHHTIDTLPPTLTKLSIGGWERNPISRDISNALRSITLRCPLLRYLWLTHAFQFETIDLPRSLETLHICDKWNLSPESSSQLPPRLKTLIITHTSELPEESLFNLPKSITALGLHPSFTSNRNLMERLLPLFPRLYTVTATAKSEHFARRMDKFNEGDQASRYSIHVVRPISSVPFPKLFINHDFPVEAIGAEDFDALDHRFHPLSQPYIWVAMCYALAHTIIVYTGCRAFSEFFGLFNIPLPTYLVAFFFLSLFFLGRWRRFSWAQWVAIRVPFCIGIPTLIIFLVMHLFIHPGPLWQTTLLRYVAALAVILCERLVRLDPLYLAVGRLTRGGKMPILQAIWEAIIVHTLIS